MEAGRSGSSLETWESFLLVAAFASFQKFGFKVRSRVPERCQTAERGTRNVARGKFDLGPGTWDIVKDVWLYDLTCVCTPTRQHAIVNRIPSPYRKALPGNHES